jgi:pyrroline-5-carboxylate reductase
MSDSAAPTVLSPVLSGRTVAFLGAGSMAGAILSGLLRAGADPAAVAATTHSAASAAALRAAHPGLNVQSVAEDAAANRTAAAAADIVVLGVEPGQIGALLDEISDGLHPEATVISIAGSVTLADMGGHLPAGVHLLRAMPNTPAQVGAGITGISVAEGVPEDAVRQAVAVFEAAGDVLVVPEPQLGLLGGVSGSGPAYFAFFVEQFTAAAQRFGLSADQASRLVESTFIGTAELLRATGRTPAELRAAVTTPGGTTEQAVAVLQRGGFDDTMLAALQAALAHAAKLRGGE